MGDEAQRLHAIISGRVQGVSFRHYTTLKANELGITGWVMNRQDGRVEVTTEGSREALQTMLDFLQRGSPHARVEQVESQWLEASGEFTEFRAKYTS
ncbi:MAG: acylphosphatase [Anaerolineae bacterium]|nr:acylphosphatase [Anaerolineae bacterium]